MNVAETLLNDPKQRNFAIFPKASDLIRNIDPYQQSTSFLQSFGIIFDRSAQSERVHQRRMKQAGKTPDFGRC